MLNFLLFNLDKANILPVLKGAADYTILSGFFQLAFIHNFTKVCQTLTLLPSVE